jgi:hypothetical protein
MHSLVRPLCFHLNSSMRQKIKRKAAFYAVNTGA